MSRKPCCEHCRFWQVTLVTEESPQEGLCRRFPPQIIGIANGAAMVPRFPKTFSSTWCGEFRWKQRDKT